jgi:hypothetical protein
MKKAKTSHLITTLKLLLEGKALSSLPNAKNFNQYPRIIKRQGIELVEAWKPNLTNGGRHKERSLHQTIENIERAKKYLYKLQGFSLIDEVQES